MNCKPFIGKGLKPFYTSIKIINYPRAKFYDTLKV